jgi:hypothetical protein
VCGCFRDVFEVWLPDLFVSGEGVQVSGLSFSILEQRLGQIGLSTTLSCGALGQFQMNQGAMLLEQGQHGSVHFLLVQRDSGKASNRSSNFIRVPNVVLK